MISGNYDIRPIDDWIRMFAVVPLEGPSDNDAAIVVKGHSIARNVDHLYCYRCDKSHCPHVQAIEDLGYKLEEL